MANNSDSRLDNQTKTSFRRPRLESFLDYIASRCDRVDCVQKGTEKRPGVALLCRQHADQWDRDQK